MLRPATSGISLNAFEELPMPILSQGGNPSNQDFGLKF